MPLVEKPLPRHWLCNYFRVNLIDCVFTQVCAALTLGFAIEPFQVSWTAIACFFCHEHGFPTRRTPAALGGTARSGPGCADRGIVPGLPGAGAGVEATHSQAPVNER